jgi:hypothetical protein
LAKANGGAGSISGSAGEPESTTGANMDDQKPDAINQESLTNDEIVTERKVPRRAFLSATGVLLAGGAAVIVAGARAVAQEASQSDPDKAKQSDPDKAKASDPDKKKKSGKMKAKKAKSEKESDPDKAKSAPPQ